MNCKIVVEELCKHPGGSRKLVDRSTLEYNPALRFPFDDIINTYKFVHADKQLIFTFTLL